MTQFQCYIDGLGNLICNGGYVIDLSAGTTTYEVVGADPVLPVTPIESTRQASPPNMVFLGGGGGNLLSSGTLTGTLAPIGWFARIDSDKWSDGFGNVIDADYGGGTAEILIGTDAIATNSSIGTAAPVGSFASTTFGETNYNGGNPFTLTVTDDGTQQVSKAQVLFVTSEAQSGIYTLTDWHEWTSDDDSDFTLTTSTDGTAQISDATNVIAERVAQSPDSPSGVYLSTAYGETTYNQSEPFRASVNLIPAVPKTGYIYLELTLLTGNLVSVGELAFGASLPANSSTLEVVPIAYSDGAGSVIQIHEGPIHYR